MGDWTDEYIQLIEDCEARDTKLSAWDVDFLSSIRTRLDRKVSLTPKQLTVLEDIWERATRNG